MQTEIQMSFDNFFFQKSFITGAQEIYMTSTKYKNEFKNM